MNIHTSIVYAAAVAIIAVASLALIQPAATNLGSSTPSAPALAVATTSTSVSVTTSVRIMATTTNPLGIPGTTSFKRAYAVVCNPNANPVYLNLDSDKPASVTQTTAVIAAAAGYSACFELTDTKMQYFGSITASSTNETATVISVKEYVY